jgi:SAM-dependent methyltransferase
VAPGYDEAFFREQLETTRRSAGKVVPVVVEALAPASVIDVGCGVGCWLEEFNRHGVTDLLGVDGDYIDRSMLAVAPGQFVAHDLERPLNLDRRWDLAVSLETAEHLSPERAESFVDDLVGLAPAVLFSAAIPGQGGVAHVNERWQDYWAELFARRGYQCVDCIRRRIWDDPAVDPWYAQNTLLYVDPAVHVLADVDHPMPLRVVHPRTFEPEPERPLSPRELLARMPDALRRAVRRRLSRR